MNAFACEHEHHAPSKKFNIRIMILRVRKKTRHPINLSVQRKRTVINLQKMTSVSYGILNKADTYNRISILIMESFEVPGRGELMMVMLCYSVN